MASPLGQVDTNKMASTAPSSTSTQQPKDKLRQWTFPRSSTTAASSPLAPQQQPSSTNSSDSEHGRSSSISPSYAHSSPSHTKSKSKAHTSKSKSSATSKDLRHRSNASVFSPPPPSALPLPLTPSANGPAPSTAAGAGAQPGNLLRLVYSNLRRRSAQDILYLVVFGGCLVLFTSALLGQGYSASGAPPALTAPAGQKVATAPPATPLSNRAQVIDVPIPQAFMRKVVVKPAEAAPADVHQPHGDSSHDQGEDLLEDSPEDPALDDENAHDHVPSPDDALFDDSHPPSLAHSHDHDQKGVQHVEITDPDSSDFDDLDLLDDDELEDTTHVAEEDGEAEDREEVDESDDIVLEEDDDGSDLRMHQAEGRVGHGHELEEEGEITIDDDEEDNDGEQEVVDLLDVNEVPEGQGDASLIPADDPLDLSLDSHSEDTEADPAALAGDALRRRGGREGIEATKREREALARERERWEEGVRDGWARAPAGRRGRAVRIR